MPTVYSKEKSKTNITVYDGNNCDYVDWRTEIVAASMYNNAFDAHENDNLPTAVVLDDALHLHIAPDLARDAVNPDGSCAEAEKCGAQVE